LQRALSESMLQSAMLTNMTIKIILISIFMLGWLPTSRGEGVWIGVPPGKKIDSNKCWVSNGKPAPLERSLGCGRIFGASLEVVDDYSIILNYDKPTGNWYKTVGSATVGTTLFTFLTFFSSGQNADGMSEVTFAGEVTLPNGKSRAEPLSGANCWSKLPTPNPNSIGLCYQSMAIPITDKDPKGEYNISVTVRDAVKKPVLKLEKTFIVN